MKFGKKPGDRRADESTAPAEKAGDMTKKSADAGGQTPGTAETPADAAEQSAGRGEQAAAGTGDTPADAAETPADAAETPATEGAAGSAEQPGGADKSRWQKSTMAAAAGAVVFTVAAAVLGWQWAEHEDPGASEVNQAFVGGAQTETTQAAEAARNIVQGVFSYSYEDLDSYQDSLAKFLDADMLARYQETADQNVQIITQAKTKIEAEVGDGNVGIEKLDDGTATAVVIMERTGTNGDSQQISDAAPLRVEMVKVDGQWKASDMRLL